MKMAVYKCIFQNALTMFGRYLIYLLIITPLNSLFYMVSLRSDYRGQINHLLSYNSGKYSPTLYIAFVTT